MAIKNAVNAK